jgi:hypothetical protein
MKNYLILSLTAFAVALALACTVHAQNPAVTWGTPTTISADSDVVTTGTFVAAFNFGAPGVASTTINGVVFSPFEVPNDNAPGDVAVGNYDVNFISPGPSSPGRESGNFFGKSFRPPYSNLPLEYQALLSPYVTTEGGGGTMALTMSGLMNGQTYLFEFWASDADLAGTNPGDITTATSTNLVSPHPNTDGFDGSPGQFVTGTFTANATGSEQITFEGFNTADMSTRAILNGFELRTVEVPEPSTWAMATVGVTSFLVLRARRK